MSTCSRPHAPNRGAPARPVADRPTACPTASMPAGGRRRRGGSPARAPPGLGVSAWRRRPPPVWPPAAGSQVPRRKHPRKTVPGDHPRALPGRPAGAPASAPPTKGRPGWQEYGGGGDHHRHCPPPAGLGAYRWRSCPRPHQGHIRWRAMSQANCSRCRTQPPTGCSVRIFTDGNELQSPSARPRRWNRQPRRRTQAAGHRQGKGHHADDRRGQNMDAHKGHRHPGRASMLVAMKPARTAAGRTGRGRLVLLPQPGRRDSLTLHLCRR